MRIRSCSSISSFVSIVLIFSFSVAPSLHAAIEKELGQALAYLRVTDIDADGVIAFDMIERRTALVLDLRSLTPAQGFAEALQAALAKPPASHAVRIILFNASTAPALVAAITETLPSVITIGPRSSATAADIAVAISDEEDRRAFAALATGTPLEKLINNLQEKPRYDEAKLVHDHANGVTPPESAMPADAEDDSVATEPGAEKPANEKAGVEHPPADAVKKAAPLIDLVLERAVQLHRSLLALKKL